MPWLFFVLMLTACMGTVPASSPARQRVLLEDGPARIDVIVEGRGPAVVLLPSSQRDSEDFDDLAQRLAPSGFQELRAVPAKDLWWPVSHAPILDLQGAEDPWRPPSTRNELRDVLGDMVTVQVIPGASHALIPEQPEAVAQAITRWIATLPP